MAEYTDSETIQYLDYEGNPIKEFEDPFGEEELKDIYYRMALARFVDEKSANMVKQGKSFFYAMASGHEAAQIGSILALGPTDWVFPYHRSIGSVLARGMSLVEFFSDVMGKSSSLNKARQMPNHFGKKAAKIVTPSSTVGNQIPEAVGTALGAKIRGDNAVSIVYFGEGAASQ
jgi:2-oxoisovalerate dehydrogenase E1 component alpha subunit